MEGSHITRVGNLYTQINLLPYFSSISCSNKIFSNFHAQKIHEAHRKYQIFVCYQKQQIKKKLTEDFIVILLNVDFLKMCPKLES